MTADGGSHPVHAIQPPRWLFGHSAVAIPRSMGRIMSWTWNFHPDGGSCMGTAKPRAFPFYIVCDVSASMWRNWPRPTPFDILSQCVGELLTELEADVTIGEATWVSVVTFADNLEVALPLIHPGDAHVVPALRKGAQTNYVALFKGLRELLPRDCANLEREYWLKQPAIFLLTDGNPAVRGVHQAYDEWTPHLDALLSPDFPYSPNIVTFGFGAAQEATLCRIATSFGQERLAYVADRSIHVTEVLRGIMRIIFITIGRSITREVLFPDIPNGMRRAGCGSLSG